MPHNGLVFEIDSQDSSQVTFTVDITDASKKIQKDQRSLWVSLTCLDSVGKIVVAQNLAVVWPDGFIGSVTFALPGTQATSFAYVWDSPDVGTQLASLTF